MWKVLGWIVGVALVCGGLFWLFSRAEVSMPLSTRPANDDTEVVQVGSSSVVVVRERQNSSDSFWQNWMMYQLIFGGSSGNYRSGDTYNTYNTSRTAPATTYESDSGSWGADEAPSSDSWGSGSNYEYGSDESGSWGSSYDSASWDSGDSGSWGSDYSSDSWDSSDSGSWGE